MLVSKGIGWYRSAKAQAHSQRKPVVPLSSRPFFAVTLLAVAAALFALYLTPSFSPENIFTLSNSQPSTSPGLLFSRLNQLRAPTARDSVIQEKFESKASRLLYYKYGGAVLADCPFCNSQDPNTYLLYAAPSIAVVHLLNAVVVGFATSESMTGKAGNQWRSLATYAAVLLLALDGFSLATWDHVAKNEKARVLDEIDFFHWTLRSFRFLSLAALDLVLAGVLYLSTTNRMFVVPPTVSERIDLATAALGHVNMRIRSANVLKNTVARDGELRAIDAGYWAHEGMVMQEAMESEEVVNSMRDAVENRRLNPEAMDEAAEQFSQQVMGGGVHQ